MSDLSEALSGALLGALDDPSPPLEVKLASGRTIRVCFRRVSDRRKQLLRAKAVAWVEQARRAAEAEDGVEIRDAQAVWEEIRDARWELLLLHAALRDPDDPDKEPISLRDFELAATSDLIETLGIKYREFERGLDIDQITPQQIEDVIEELKKKPLSLVELWQQYGFAILAASLLTLVSQLPESETKKSSPGSSIEP